MKKCKQNAVSVYGEFAFILFYLTFFPNLFHNSSFPIIHINHLLHVDAAIISSSMPSFVNLWVKYMSMCRKSSKAY